MDLILLQYIRDAGGLGVGAFLGTLIFLMYRKDRLATERMWKDSKKFTDILIERDQKTREDNTRATTELITLLTRMNGNSKR